MTLFSKFLTRILAWPGMANNAEFKELCTTESLRRFALSMLNTFIPIYLITIGYSIPSVMGMYFIEALLRTLLAIPAARLALRYGFKKINILTTPLFIGFIILLWLAKTISIPLLVLAIVKESGELFYDLWYHTHISQSTSAGTRGRQISLKNILTETISLPGPFLGGLILAFLGMPGLLIVVALVLIASAIPLYRGRETIVHTVPLTLRTVIARRTWRQYMVFFLYGMDKILSDVAWQIFVFFSILQSYVALGLVVFLNSIFSLGSGILIGTAIDKNRNTMLRFGAPLGAFAWMVRIAARTSGAVYLADSLDGIAKKSITTSLDARSYDISEEDGTISFIIFREMAINLGRVTLYGILYFLSDWTYAFWGGAILSLTYLFW